MPPHVHVNQAVIERWTPTLTAAWQRRRTEHAAAVRRDGWSAHCWHDSYIGTPSGPDYLCGLCEDGTTPRELGHRAAYDYAERCARWDHRHAILHHAITARNGDDPTTTALLTDAMAYGTPPWVTPMGRGLFTVGRDGSASVKFSWAAAAPHR